MIETDWRRLLIFGGSFDPPHVGHGLLANLAREAIGADAVGYVPAANPPHKRQRIMTSAHHRLAMLRLLLQDEPRSVILHDELERARLRPDAPSYTVDTLEGLHQRLPGVQLWLLIGDDQLRMFPSWKNAERILQLAEVLVMVRPPGTVSSVLAQLPAGYTVADWEPRLIKLPVFEASSTQIRQRVKQGQSLHGLVPVAVEDYIRRHRLYVAP